MVQLVVACLFEEKEISFFILSDFRLLQAEHGYLKHCYTLNSVTLHCRKRWLWHGYLIHFDTLHNIVLHCPKRWLWHGWALGRGGQSVLVKER